MKYQRSQCLVLKNQGGEMVVAIQSKGENWFWNWGTLLQTSVTQRGIGTTEHHQCFPATSGRDFYQSKSSE
ncbi:hypothetical protein CapIbe_016914 [Capra ibex]